jgi:hypothetical protein
VELCSRCSLLLTPRQPAIDSGNSGSKLPKIRIHSEQKGPEAVVIDTSQPIIGPPLTANGDVPKAVSPPAPQVAENVAQFVSPSLSQTDVKELSKVEPRPHSRRNVGKARTKRPPVSYALRPDIGPFDSWFTIGQQDARIRDSFAQSVPREQRQGRARREVTWARTDNARRPHFGWFDNGW